MTTTLEYSFVLDKNGTRLSPTKVNKAWYLIRKKKAKLINKYPMVIQLNKIVENSKDTSKVISGIDDGSSYVGIGLVQQCETKNKPIFKATIELRQDVSTLMESRQKHRGYHRQHKRYREKRFDNRKASKKKGRIAPSIRQKKDSILRVFKMLNKWINIDTNYLEDVKIDIRELTEGEKLHGREYQISDRLSENRRLATLMRDNFTCQMCGCKKGSLHSHHVNPRRNGGSDSLKNRITLCEECHEKVTGVEENYMELFYNIIKGRNIDLKSAMHVMQGKTYLRQELSKLFNLHLTMGCDTALRRMELNISKSHSNDALVCTGLNFSDVNLTDWIIKPMRRKSKATIEEINGFRHRDLVKYTKKSGEVYVGYITALYPEKKQCNITTTDGKILKRYGIKPCKLIWRFNKAHFLNVKHIVSYNNKKIKT